MYKLYCRRKDDLFVTEDKNRKQGGQLAILICVLKKMKNDTKFLSTNQLGFNPPDQTTMNK